MSFKNHTSTLFECQNQSSSHAASYQKSTMRHCFVSQREVYDWQTFMHSSSFALFGIVGVQIILIVCIITSCVGGMNLTITPCFYNSIFRLFIRFVNQTSEYNGNSIKCCHHPNCSDCMTVWPVAQYRRKSFCLHIFGQSKHFWTIHFTHLQFWSGIINTTWHN